MIKSFQSPMVVTELRRVCHIHYRIYTASPIEEPESFFDLLGLDPSKLPFSDPDWLKSSERVHLEAVDLILEHWAERKNRLIKDEQASEREYHLDQASAALMNIPTAKVYMTIIIPSIRHKRGDERLEALQRVCSGYWEVPPSFG